MPNPQAIETIHRLWDELALIPASAPEQRLQAVLEGVGRLIGARHGLWLSACRVGDQPDEDVLSGWRALSVYFMGELDTDQATYERALKKLDRGGRGLAEADESTLNHLRQSGRFRATRLVDHVSPGYFDSPFFADHYASRDIRDRLFVVLPVSADVESYFMFDRMVDQPAFEPDTCDIAAYAFRSLTWFVRQLHLGYGQIAAAEPLTPMERLVLRYLLKGLAQKSIARQAHHSPNTTRQHVKNIFCKFNVRSRAELLSLWLGG